MRILHTSDWHLGRTFHGASLLDEQAEALDRIVELTSEADIELVVIAGDLYDRALPPAEAVTLFGEAIARLRSTAATVVAISGNHDSSIRVGVHDSLMTATGVTIRGDVCRASEPVMIEPADGGPPVAVYPLPYLDPTLAGPILAFASESEPEPETDITSRHRLRHDEVTRLATDRIRADLATRRGARSVVVAHTFVEGGVTCESERELTVGNIESVGVDAFSGFDCVALGHLHGPQQRDGARVAYSGTPLPYSFSEQGQTKSVRIVEIAPDATLTVEVVPLGVGRSLRTIEGTIDDLLSRVELADAEPARVRVLLTDAHLPMQAMARLRERFPYAAELRHRPEGVEPGSGGATERDTADPAASPLAVTLQFWAEQHGAEADAAEAELLGTALDDAGRSADQ